RAAHHSRLSCFVNTQFLGAFEPFRLWLRVCGSVASGEANYMLKTPIWEEVCEKIFTTFALLAAVSRRS
ncbi:hypothetical protein, partial [Xanthomonas hortorum]|uniref:hypothetical protein n=1 Tax=Xanthomonas hortorum TaxID=56454 RepID=UPI001CA4ABC7